jgi:hypothetical protein
MKYTKTGPKLNVFPLFVSKGERVNKVLKTTV